MLLVTQTDALSAARASIAAVVRNPKPMALWAALIAVMIAAGFATMLVGLVIVIAALCMLTSRIGVKHILHSQA